MTKGKTGPTTREGLRKKRDSLLKKLRDQRRIFWLPQEITPDKIAERLAASGPDAAASELHELMQREGTLRNAQAWLCERLRCAIRERDALEAALAEERRDREAAEYQLRRVLAEQDRQLDEVRRKKAKP